MQPIYRAGKNILKKVENNLVVNENLVILSPKQTKLCQTQTTRPNRGQRKHPSSALLLSSLFAYWQIQCFNFNLVI